MLVSAITFTFLAVAAFAYSFWKFDYRLSVNDIMSQSLPSAFAGWCFTVTAAVCWFFYAFS